ncbi:IS3 family transposase [Deinococcus sp. QL22]|uniref:IS3 family transposase n=1 Tax=Deinococcus sp. QL22 TaxID=2939437 RepID=UPI0020177410|nr:IS3 family transposase [Deinococcus sp. QL22]UQN09049.1 IS3 family transposase [Deinococcus sp. QL22]
MTASKNHYTAEFKEEAVRLVISSQKSCAEIARNLGVPPYLVVRWKQHHEQQGAVGRPQFTGRGVAALSEQEARFKKLERELEITRQERDILKKAPGLLRQRPLIYGFIEQHRHEYSIERLCKTLGVGVSGYFAWWKAQNCYRVEDVALTEAIRTIHQVSRGTYGAPRVQAALVDEGKQVSRARITRLMKAAGLKARCKRKFRVTTNSKHPHPVAENLLNREFVAEQPNQKWVTDITYLPVAEGWMYLAVVMDLFSRKIVGWAMRATLQTELVVAALDMAQQIRRPGQGLLHHSDQGIQYASREYRQALERLQALQSMSRKGDCWDNAAMESFFATLKLELELDTAQGNRADTRNLVFEWIEVFYNRERRHSSLGYRSPTRFEQHRATLN